VKRVGQASSSYWVSTLNSRKHGANQFQKNALHVTNLSASDHETHFVIVGYLLLGYLKGGPGQSKTNCDRVQGEESNWNLLLKFM
jgi:hypothetical protein